MPNTRIYRDQMFETISNLIEQTGSEDTKYTDNEKARDILEVLESLLAYSIYNTCMSPPTIRDACEESYVNIKKRALALYNQFGTDNQVAEKE